MDDFRIYMFKGWCLDVGHLYLFCSAFNVSFDPKTTLFSPSLYLFLSSMILQSYIYYFTFSYTISFPFLLYICFVICTIETL